MKLSLPGGVTRTVAMTVLKTKKHSPTILFGAGIALGVVTVVSACKATLKVEEVLTEHRKYAMDINSAVELNSSEYTTMDHRQEMTILYIRTAMKFTRLYGPAVIAGIGAVSCLTGAHRIQNQRLAGLAAAYSAVDKAFKDYRERVVEEYGEEKDRELRHGTDTKTVKIAGKNGEEKNKKFTRANSSSPSMYARLFGPHNPNWNPQPDYNVAFLKSQQKFATDRLRSRGHLFLNEVYDALGLDHTTEGAVVGWIYDKGGDDFVDFGIWTQNADKTLEFMNGWEDELLLDFNVDGVIYKEI